jgi:cardiolipin synthase
MTISVAIPIYRVNCVAIVERVRAWSVVDELVLLSLVKDAMPIPKLVEGMNLNHQVVLASVARMMRFRLIEVSVIENEVFLGATPFGREIVRSGEAMPTFPTTLHRPVSFVIERVSGDFFYRRDIKYRYKSDIETELRGNSSIRVIAVDGGSPEMDQASNVARLSELVSSHVDDKLVSLVSRTFQSTDVDYMLVKVDRSSISGLPSSAGAALREAVRKVANTPANQSYSGIAYKGTTSSVIPPEQSVRCTIEADDAVVGGDEQRECLIRLLGTAHRRAIIHSGFLDVEKFRELEAVFRAACIRGVKTDILWGADSNEDTRQRNAIAASNIAALIRADPVMRGNVIVHPRTTGSHTKLILVDSRSGKWTSAVGSCNWLFSPFKSVELSIVIRSDVLVANVVTALQRLLDRGGVADDLARDLAITARDIRRDAKEECGPGEMELVTGERHDTLIRYASRTAAKRFIVGSNKLGSTARPGALMQSALAASTPGVEATVIFTDPSGPLRYRHVRELVQEAASQGVRLMKTRSRKLHGKFVLWDSDNVIVTSLNWASASTDDRNPVGELGVHVNSPGFADVVLAKLETLLPELTESSKVFDRE